jgi:hypothetical protein
LEQLLNGRFEYEVPHLLLSETEVALTLDEGQNFRGELNIGAEDGRRVKGIVTTDHQRIVLAKNQFQGTASTIEYGVDTSGLKLWKHHRQQQSGGTLRAGTRLDCRKDNEHFRTGDSFPGRFCASGKP